jgi:hypothetical protein
MMDAVLSSWSKLGGTPYLITCNRHTIVHIFGYASGVVEIE